MSNHKKKKKHILKGELCRERDGWLWKWGFHTEGDELLRTTLHGATRQYGHRLYLLSFELAVKTNTGCPTSPWAHPIAPWLYSSLCPWLPCILGLPPVHCSVSLPSRKRHASCRLCLSRQTFRYSVKCQRQKKETQENLGEHGYLICFFLLENQSFETKAGWVGGGERGEEITME